MPEPRKIPAVDDEADFEPLIRGRFWRHINLKTATLGLTVPQSPAARADEIIE